MIHKMEKDFSIELLDLPFSISPTLQATVDSIWEEEKRLKGEALFDGLILNAIDVSAHRLAGHWINYQYALAAYRQPDLAKRLGVHTVAVNGITMAGKRVLLARRAKFVSQNPGCWELVPSGGIDPTAKRDNGVVDHRSALLTELEEETGLSRERVKAVEPLILVLDPSTSTWEMVLEIHLVGETTPQLTSSEYEEFTWVDRTELRSFLDRYDDEEVVPLTRTLVDMI